MMPYMRQVFSSNVAEVGYDADTAELFVTWKSGKTSVYTGVPADVAQAAMTAYSVGQAIQQDIIPNYPHRYER